MHGSIYWTIMQQQFLKMLVKGDSNNYFMQLLLLLNYCTVYSV